jgi:hypothetical protein
MKRFLFFSSGEKVYSTVGEKFFSLVREAIIGVLGSDLSHIYL